MRISIVSIGKVKQKFVRLGEEEYLERLVNEHKIEFTELAVEHAASLPEAEIKAKEAKLLLASFKDNQCVIALDERGTEFSSVDFSKLLESKMNRGQSNIAFVIGGAFGLDESIRKRAEQCISLSQLTFTYQMTRLILVEQIYRAFMIIKGSPYHKQ